MNDGILSAPSGFKTKPGMLPLSDRHKGEQTFTRQVSAGSEPCESPGSARLNCQMTGSRLAPHPIAWPCKEPMPGDTGVNTCHSASPGES